VHVGLAETTKCAHLGHLLSRNRLNKGFLQSIISLTNTETLSIGWSLIIRGYPKHRNAIAMMVSKKRGRQKMRKAARFTAASFGVMAGLGGLIHGIGEMLQGNITPSGMWIDSWTQGPIATHMGGDPGLTIVPNLLITGVLASLVSLATIAWAAAFVRKKHGGAVLILLSIAMLLVGGGVGPPVVGILAGIAGTAINAPLPWWRARFSGNAGRLLAQLWPWVFGVALINGLFLFVGSIILVHALDWGNADLYLNSFFLVVVSLLPTIITGIAYDLRSGEIGTAVHS
jgi:hypothetical protein